MYPQQNPFDAMAAAPQATAGQPFATYQPQGQAAPAQPTRPVPNVGGVGLPAGAKGRRRFGPLGPSPMDFLPHPFRPNFGMPPMGLGQPPMWGGTGQPPTPGGTGPAPMAAGPGFAPQWPQPGQTPSAFSVPGGRWVFVPDGAESPEKE